MPRTKRISLRGLADFMTARPSRQRTILRDYKYPAEDEPRARILYYRDARDIIRAYHRSGESHFWLLAQASNLRELAAANSGPTRTRLNYNSHGVRAYATHFAERRFEVLPELRLMLRFGDVEVSVFPELHVREGKREKIVKLEFSATPPELNRIRVISQAMFEAAEVAGLGISSSQVLYLDVPRGNEHRGARLGARMRNDIEATCQIISAIWDTL